MLKLKIENVKLTEQDEKQINATRHYIELYPEDNLLTAWNECYSKCNFENHITGRGGNHIWITRKIDNKRIAIITED